VSEIKDGGPAFPRARYVRPDDAINDGMSLRAWFAGMAMQGLIPIIGIPEVGPDELWDADTAKRAVKLADAMLAELSKPRETEGGRG